MDKAAAGSRGCLHGGVYTGEHRITKTLQNAMALFARTTSLTGILLALCGNPAVAATTTTTFQVSATVAGSCSVSATHLSFGTYTPGNTLPTDAASTISVNCTLLTPYHVRLDKGLNGSSVTGRKMVRAGGPETLGYGLYRDEARNLNWGETDGTDTVDGVGTGANVSHTVYGRIPAEQSVPPDSYSDTITVTVSY